MEYNIEFVEVSELKPYENNVKIHDDVQIDYIIKSIKQFGFKQNLVIDKNNVIIIGHGRFEAAKRIGMKSVPCIRATDLSEEQIKALRIADNKLSEKAVWDNDALSEELKSIGESIDMTDLGFGGFELDILTKDFEPEKFDEDDIEGYKNIGDNLLKYKRIIISYLPEQEELVKKILGVNEIKKSIYDISEINNE